MSRQKFQFKIKSITDHTPLIRELELQTFEPQEFKFRAGQFVMLHVPQENQPKPALRAYSIASSDQNNSGFKLIFKFVENGLASNYVWNLKNESLVEMTGPFGKVFFQEPPTEQIVFLNTGSGVSQHFCFLESMAHKYPNLKYKMFFGVRYESDIYYQKELAKLKSNFTNFEFEYVISRPSAHWTGLTGYVQNHLEKTQYKNIPTTFYLCGNGAMIKDVKHQLIEIDQFDKSKIWSEAFD